MRFLVVTANSIDGRVRGGRIEAARVDERNLAPRCDRGRRDVLPALTPVLCYVDQAIVGTGPNHVYVLIRRSHCINDASTRLTGKLWCTEHTDAFRHLRFFA